METLDDARRAIDAVREAGGLNALLATFGFNTPSLALDRESLSSIGLAETLATARVSAGEGSLRALIVENRPGETLRECITSTAHQLAKHSPQFLWLLVALESPGDSIAIAVWRQQGASRRIGVINTRPGHVLDSDAEAFCSLAAATAAPNDAMRHMRWVDILGRDSITRRFFLALTSSIDGLVESLPSSVPHSHAVEIALLTTSRLVFLSFLETKGWLDRDFGFLENGFTECMSARGGYQRHVLESLFFGTLNTRVRDRAPRARTFGRVPFLNGGLFARTALERIHRNARFSDEALGNLFGDVLIRYRFTASEDIPTWSQTAIDPEILGRVFEAVMASGDRKRDGVFYTPQKYVERVTTLSLCAVLKRHGFDSDLADRIVGAGCAPAVHDPRTLEIVSSLRILDPSCGSGAFLVHALERISRIRANAGDTSAQSDIRRDVLTRSIFGVDANPTAVWLCELRLWLAVVIDSGETDPMRVTPLPNLDRNIRIGDSLAGDAFNRSKHRIQATGAISVLRARYTRSTGKRKAFLGRSLDTAERQRALALIDVAVASTRHERRERVAAARARDLFDTRQTPEPATREQLRRIRTRLRSLHRRRHAIVTGAKPAFAYSIHFADVADAGGFDLILANPPWVRLHNIPPEERVNYRERFEVMRLGAWSEGARGAHASAGFAGQVDVSGLFVERAIGLLAPGGTLGCLLPSKLWRCLAGGGVRRLLLDHTALYALEDHDDTHGGFDAAVYPSVMVTTRVQSEVSTADNPVNVAIQSSKHAERWQSRQHLMAFDTTAGSPWIILPPECRDAFDALSKIGPPLFESVLGRPRLGVKTGCNEAFIVCSEGQSTTEDGCSVVSRGTRRGAVETTLLRPLVRGETLSPWRLIPNDEHIVWTHAPDGSVLRRLPAGATRWLVASRGRLERRVDSRSARWWALFRIECASCMTPRVVWADFGRRPRAAVLDAFDTTVPLNTCYSIACQTDPDALALAAILNSGVAAAWLGALAEPARGGYKRFLGWTVSRLPVPADWMRARHILADIARKACDGRPPDPGALDLAVLDAYGLDHITFAPLLEWSRSRNA